jgi:hypothetical protein
VFGKVEGGQTFDVQQKVIFTVGYGLDSASSSRLSFKKCVGGYHDQYKIVGAVNNISIVVPSKTKLLEPPLFHC